MVTLRPVKIAGLSTYVPPKVLTNADLEKMVETSNEWILQRTGIRERHIVEPGQGTSDIAEPAARAAIEEAGITPKDIGFIVVGTTTPDTIFPSTACTLQAKIGAVNAWGFDLGAACSGFTYAFTAAYQMVATGAVEHALVVGADVMSSIIDYTDRATCILFGDGAGAVVLSPAAAGEPAIIDFAHVTDGTGGPALCMPAGGSRLPASHETVDERLHYVKQDGQAVFKFAVRMTEEISRRLLDAPQSHARRRGPVRLASGQPPHHRGRGRAAWPRSEEGHHQPRQVRQHDGRDDPARARRRARGEAPQEGRSRAARVGGRGVYGRIDTSTVESVTGTTSTTGTIGTIGPRNALALANLESF